MIRQEEAAIKKERKDLEAEEQQEEKEKVCKLLFMQNICLTQKLWITSFGRHSVFLMIIYNECLNLIFKCFSYIQ